MLQSKFARAVYVYIVRNKHARLKGIDYKDLPSINRGTVGDKYFATISNLDGRFDSRVHLHSGVSRLKRSFERLASIPNRYSFPV